MGGVSGVPILDNPLEHQDEKITKYLEGGRPFSKFSGAPKGEKIQKVRKKAEKTEKSWKTITD